MNELDSLSRLRDDVPAPNAEVLAGARAVLAERAKDSVLTPMRRPVSMRRRALVSLAAAAAIAAGAIAVTSGGHSPRDTTAGGANHSATNTRQAGPGVTVLPAHANAAKLLDLAAKGALSKSAVAPAAGQFTYTVTHTWQSADSPDDGILYLAELKYEQWKPVDTRDTWYWRTSTVSLRFFRASDRAYIAAHNPEALVLSTETSSGTDGKATKFDPPLPTDGPHLVPGAPQAPGWDTPTAAWMASLPRDTAALRADLYAHTPADSLKLNQDGLAFETILAVFQTGEAPADLQAALYRVLTTIPGITVVDRSADLDGRQGVALGFLDRWGTRQDIIIDPANGTYIGNRETVVKPNIGSGYGGGAANGYVPPNRTIVPVGEAMGSSSITVSVADKPDFG